MLVVEVLVSVKTPTGAAGVLLDADGDVWLSAELDRPCGPRLDDYRPDHVGLSDDRTLIGGRLASRAVGAEVVDDAGRRIRAAVAGGAWVAVLDQPILGPRAPAWCWDVKGTPIAPELPGDWPRSRVQDADEACPACGHTVWDQVTATDDSRGMHGGSSRPPSDPHYAGMEPSPFVVCCACGHEESIGGLTRFVSSSEEEAAENARRYQHALRDMRERQLQTLETVRFPVFADRGSRAVMSGSGSANGVTNSVKVRHGVRADQAGPALEIETTEREQYRDTEYVSARRELERWLHSPGADLPTERSDAGLIIAWRALDRERRRRAATAVRGEMLVRVDGNLEPFVCVQCDEHWVAVRHREHQTLTIAARQIDPDGLDLRPLREPVSELDWDQA